MKTASGEDSPFDWLPRDPCDLLWLPYFFKAFVRGFEVAAMLNISSSSVLETELFSNLAFFGVLSVDWLPFRLERRRGDALACILLHTVETPSRIAAKPSSSVVLQASRLLVSPFTLKFVGGISPRPTSSSSEL